MRYFRHIPELPNCLSKAEKFLFPFPAAKKWKIEERGLRAGFSS